MRWTVMVLGLATIGWMGRATAQDACVKLMTLKLPDNTITLALTSG
jgi:hypothetical protein